MSDKKVTIKFDATGAESVTAAAKKAADSIEKITESARELTKSQDGLEAGSAKVEGAMDSIVKLNTQIDQLSLSWTKASEESSKAAESLEGTSQEATKASKEMNRVTTERRLAAVEKLAGGIKEIGGSLRETADKFREGSPEIADQLDGAATSLDTLSGAMNGAATGFAVGGPFGAAIGGLIGGAMVPLKNSFEDMMSSLAKASASKALAAEMAQKLKDAQNGSMEAYFQAQERSEELAKAYEDEKDALDDLMDSIERRSRVDAAARRATTATRDRADAAKIRGGSDPEIVKQARIELEKGEALQEIDKDLKNKRDVVKKITESRNRAEKDLRNLQSVDGTEEEELKKGAQRVDDWNQRLKSATDDLNTAEEIATQKRIEITETAAGKIEELSDRRQKRIQRNQVADPGRAAGDANQSHPQGPFLPGIPLPPHLVPVHPVQGVAPAPYVQPPINPAIQAKKDSQAAVAREGVALIPEGTDRRLKEAIELAASGLQNGDQGGEMEDFLRLMEKLAETVSQSGKKGSSLEGRIQQLTTKISTMQQQISNLNGR